MSVFDLMNPFEPWLTSRSPSVYVISDSEMKAYKQKQAVAEIAELQRLVDGHKSSIERLETHISQLETELPKLTETSNAA
jgi:septal ring factor EnvC (AmiA/AmiB activator)